MTEYILTKLPGRRFANIIWRLNVILAPCQSWVVDFNNFSVCWPIWCWQIKIFSQKKTFLSPELITTQIENAQQVEGHEKRTTWFRLFLFNTVQFSATDI